MRLIPLATVLLLISAGGPHAESTAAASGGTFHLPDFVYRIVALWVCYICGEKLRRGLVERQITPWRDLLDFYKQVYDRDTMPIRYWMEIGQMATGVASGLFVMIFGWWQPTN